MPPHRRDSTTATVLILGVGQAVSWGSSFYLPAILADAMARDLGVSVPTVFAAFSAALGISALPGPWFGRIIDRRGGRPLLMATNILFFSGLLALAGAREAWGLFLAWAWLGVAMGGGLYEAAFATVVRLQGAQSRNAITGLTLIAGFASTVGWPLTAWMEAHHGWRGACIGWAVMHLVLGLPLHALLPRAQPSGHRTENRTKEGASTAGGAGPSRNSAHSAAPTASLVALLAFVFAATHFIATAMAAHLPRLLQEMGASATAAVAVGALVGPAQVGARLLEFALMRHLSPLVSARLASLGHPLGILALGLLGPPAGPTLAILHGAGNGVLTITRGMLPLMLFGADGYGEKQGWLMFPARLAQALAPVTFGLLLAWSLPVALWVSAALGIAVTLALMGLPSSPATSESAPPQ